MQNGYHPKDLFDPVDELRRARATKAGHGEKWADEHTKTEAVLDTALKAHDKDSAKTAEEDDCNVSAQILLAVSLHLHGSCICPTAMRFSTSW